MKKYPLLPSLLLTLASVLFLYSRVTIFMYPEEIVRPLLILWFIILLLYVPGYWLTHDWNWAGLLMVVLVLGCFTSTLFAYTYTLAILAILAGLWVTIRFLWKRKLDFKITFTVINILSLVAIVMTLSSLYSLLRTIPHSYLRDTFDVTHSQKFIPLKRDSKLAPDIYYIVLDGYGRQDILQQLYGFDNAEFIASLEEKGFIVPKQNHSNYPKTVLSLSSTLNMDYVQNFVPNLESSDLWWLMSPWLDHNLVRTSLERIGYSSVSMSTDWSITDNPTTNYYYKSHPVILSELDRYILGVTPLRSFQSLLQNIATAPTYTAHRRSQLKSLESLVRTSAIPGPKFVFAHILLPHPPFVFASDGSELDPGYSYSLNDASGYPGTINQYRKLYVGQTQFLNSQIEPVIDTIFNHSKTPPIIILQADHGPGMLTDSSSAAHSCLAERFSPFAAYYLPGMDPKKIPDNITPVNLFRILFNEYFDANLPILENVQYYPRQGSIYNLETVYPEIDGNVNCSLK